MTIAELIAELQGKDPAALVVIDREYHSNWYLDTPDGLEDRWVKPNEGEFDTSVEGADGAVPAVRIW